MQDIRVKQEYDEKRADKQRRTMVLERKLGLSAWYPWAIFSESISEALISTYWNILGMQIGMDMQKVVWNPIPDFQTTFEAW